MKGGFIIMKNDLNEKILNSYNVINDYANSNIGLQGLSGFVGFPATIAIDGAIIFTHYAPMVNKIRQIYGMEPFSREYIISVIKSISSDVLMDLMLDKTMGQIPIVGVYFNAICAKAFTWRLGILFSILSCTNEKDEIYIKKYSEFIRNVFTQKDVIRFRKPSYETFKKIISSTSNGDLDVFRDRVNEAMKAFEI